VDVTRPQRKRTTEKHQEKRSGEGDVDSGLRVQLEEDGDGSTRQNGWRRVVFDLWYTGSDKAAVDEVEYSQWFSYRNC